MNADPDQKYDLEKWRVPSINATEAILGDADYSEYHAPILFDAGAEMGGAPDIIKFSGRGEWVAYVTAELIGRDNQIRNTIGNYELMLCLPKGVEAHWATDMLAALAYASLEAAFEPGETCDIGETPEGSTITWLLFSEYARFRVRDRACGLLLCIGITEPEMRLCHRRAGFLWLGKGSARLQRMLRGSGVYPVTDFFRISVV